MSQIIAGIYEINQEIGSGGGGVVYLGRHLRLQKLVVLKADRRKLTTKAEKLRREVDMLKNLSHTYIPQVYDFVEDNGIVYTVMDYIEGESLDKILKRGEKIPQADVIRWACQILEALDYLHNRPPHGILHGDIKPANIMLRPNGDVCLIDFNIALALNEAGAVKVGFSRGYASPEHYGIEYAGAKYQAVRREQTPLAQAVSSEVTEADMQVSEESEKTVYDTMPAELGTFPSVSETKSNTGVLLNVRSDIYSLGATLYHLLSGRRPAQNVMEVEPLGAEACSPAVAAIIKKAMQPEPEKRYQTAEEMLKAFLLLFENDTRTKRYKRQQRIAVAAITALALTGSVCTYIGLKQQGEWQEELAAAAYSADMLQSGDVSKALETAFSVIPKKESVWVTPCAPQAQNALTEALGVYRLEDGFEEKQLINLPANPFDMTLSPSGEKLAVVYGYEAAVYRLEDGELLAALPVQESALSDCVFLDENTILYASDSGIAAYALDKKETLWSGDTATRLTVSADGSTAAAVNTAADYAVVYDTATGEKKAECSFGDKHLQAAANERFADPKDVIFSLSSDGAYLAVSFSDGGLTIFDVQQQENSMLVLEESGYYHFQGGFYGSLFAYTAGDGAKSMLGFVNTATKSVLGESISPNTLLLSADEDGIYLADNHFLMRIDESLAQTELAYLEDAAITAFSVGEEYVLVSGENNTVSLFDRQANQIYRGTGEHTFDFALLGERFAAAAGRDTPAVRILERKTHDEQNFLSYDAGYRHDEARVSADGQTVMLFGIYGFRIYNADGTFLYEMELADSDTIYDQQFCREGDSSYLEVIWYDGTVRRYSAADGALLKETKEEQPQENLYQEFYTDDYKMTVSLHESPQVYDKKTGNLLRELEKEDYLTYVTQLGEYVVTEYISVAGERYGLLLNDKLETLAYLPNLCDIAEDKLYFDDEKSGNLRWSRLYRLQELTELVETQIKTQKPSQ